VGRSKAGEWRFRVSEEHAADINIASNDIRTCLMSMKGHSLHVLYSTVNRPSELIL
jgi:hypothetical protein